MRRTAFFRFLKRNYYTRKFEFHFRAAVHIDSSMMTAGKKIHVAFFCISCNFDILSVPRWLIIIIIIIIVMVTVMLDKQPTSPLTNGYGCLSFFVKKLFVSRAKVTHAYKYRNVSSLPDSVASHLLQCDPPPGRHRSCYCHVFVCPSLSVALPVINYRV